MSNRAGALGSFSYRTSAQGRTFAILISLQVIASSLSGFLFFLNHAHDSNVLMGIVETPTWITLLSIAARVVVLIAAFAIFFGGMALRSRISGGVLLLFLLMAYPLLRALADADFSLFSKGLDLVALIALALATASRPPKVEQLKILGTLGFATALVALAFAALRPANAFMPSTWGEKVIPGLPVLAGPMNHSNTLGMVLALSLPFILIQRPSFTRLLMLATVIGVIAWSGSRTALLASAFGIGLAVLARTAPGAWVFCARILMVTVAIAIVAVPLLSGPHTFSDRGTIWAWAAGQHVSASDDVFGVAGDWPARATPWADGAPATSAHNLFVQWYFIGGILLLGVGVWLLILVARKALNTRNVLVVAFVVELLTISMLEFIISPATGSPLFPFVMIPMISILTLPRENEVRVA